MRLSARVKRLDDAAYTSWREAWDAHLDAVIDLLPPDALTIFCGHTVDDTPENDDLFLEAANAALDELGLDKGAWADWDDAVGEVEAFDLDNREEAKLGLLPAHLPPPPLVAVKELELMRSWQYEDTAQGFGRSCVAFFLARSVVINGVHRTD